jgi:mannose-6-phosphate isomerase-like protein (cupin superfamily)
MHLIEFDLITCDLASALPERHYASYFQILLLPCELPHKILRRNRVVPCGSQKSENLAVASFCGRTLRYNKPARRNSIVPDLEIQRWPEDRTIDQKTVAEIWARDGFTCNLWVDPPGQQWLDFMHPTDERVVVKEGKIEFKVEDARAILGPGDQVLISAGSRHSVWNRGSSTARWFYCYKHR